MKNLTITGCLLIIVTGCSLFNGGDDDKQGQIKRTLPHAFNYEQVSFSSLKDSVRPPDSVNVNAYVVSTTFCPPDSYCIAPDGIFLSDHADSAGSKANLFLQVREPRQFKEGNFYEFSIGLTTYSGNEKKHYALLGYSLKEAPNETNS